MPTGYVVGIISRNWREYVATFAEDEVHFVMIYCLSSEKNENCIFSYVVESSHFVGGGSQSAQGNPPACHRSLTNVIRWCCIGYASP